MSIFKSIAEGASAPFQPAAEPRRILQGTGQQEALWAELAEGDRHLVVEARAGSGKSSSCREGMWRLLERRPGLAVRYAVYNTANAEEFRADCPPAVDVATIHSFGFHALKRAFRSTLEKNKTYLLLDETREGRNLPRYLRKSVALLVGQAKNQYATPAVPEARLRELLTHYDINAYGRPGIVADMAAEVLQRSADWVEIVDFDDMVWLCAVHRVDFPPCDVLFLDEVQDWNPVQHALIPLACPSGRVVAVGDSFQAIYSWRGADPDSLPRLREHLRGTSRRCADLPLTLTFRCPRSHVRLANQYVSDLEAAPGNPEGTLEHCGPDRLQTAAPGDLVICPTNGPVIAAALRLIAQGRRALVRGRAVGDQLVSVVRGCGDCRTLTDLAAAVQRWQHKELLRLADMDGVEDLIESVNDRAAGLHAVLSACQSPADMEPAIDRLFARDFSDETVNFSTIHRAKGGEANSVWLLEAPTRQPEQDWEVQQARNLRYVALTRSRDRLVFVQV